MVQGAAAHEGQGRNFEQTLLERAGDAVEAHELVERVVQGPQIRVDLLRQVAREKTQALPGFDRRAREHDALHLVALQCVHCAGHGQEGLARAGRAHTEGDVVLQDVVQVVDLVGCAALQVGTARVQHGLGRQRRSVGDRPISWLQSLGRLAQQPLEAFFGQIALARAGADFIEHRGRALGGPAFALDANHGCAPQQAHSAGPLDGAEVFVQRAAYAQDCGGVFIGEAVLEDQEDSTAEV